MEILAVGMPRSGSRMFHDLMTEIGNQSGAFNVPNPTGFGRQHAPRHVFSGLSDDRVVFGIHRDLRDVAVSYARYVMEHHEIQADDPLQATGKHPIWHAMQGDTFEDAVNAVLEHEAGLPFCVQWLRSYEDEPYCHLTQFEDMINDPNTIAPLFQSVGLKISPNIIASARAKYSFERNHEINPIHYRNGWIGKWEAALLDHQVQKIEELKRGGVECQTT